MLVLERKLQQGFWVDKDIFVKVISIGKRRVKLGIEAPASMHITRDELTSNGEHRTEVFPGRRRQE